MFGVWQISVSTTREKIEGGREGQGETGRTWSMVCACVFACVRLRAFLYVYARMRPFFEGETGPTRLSLCFPFSMLVHV